MNMTLDVDRLIYTILDIYQNIVAFKKDNENTRGFIKKRRAKNKYHKYLDQLNEIIVNLPYSNIILSTNSITEFVSYIIHSSNLDNYGCITKIIEKESNYRSIYLVTVTSYPYKFDIKLDMDNESMNINMQSNGENGYITANTKLSKLESNSTSFVSQCIKQLNHLLLTEISSYIVRYIKEMREDDGN